MDLSPLNAEGQTYHDFLVTKYLPLEELQSTLIELVHEPTGARITQIANDDPENLFCLSFQTLPDSSNGVAHILEHTVLCGSEKFPIKDPFFSMARRSLNTFMNALTGQDITCYPASSQVRKDFYNLLEVYLDAVFHPKLHHLSFLQEGHRLELSEKGLKFQGIVYNEMKGALSSPEERLWHALHKHLIPDLPYAYNSGGDPKEILSLSYEEFVEFHRNFYHPSRCCFFFYGNLPLAGHLDFLSEKALAGVGKVAPLAPLPKQKRFSSPLVVIDRYPTTDLSQKKDLVALSWLTASLTDQGEVLALSLLDSLLMDTDASPLKKALLKSGLCSDAYSSLDPEMSEVPWTFVFRECAGDDAEALRALTLETIEKVRFSKEEIDASLHQLEFERKEIGAEGWPYGLTLFFRSIPLKQHGSDAENGLMIHRLFSELRAKLENPHYLSSLLKKYLLDNPHSVLLTLKADPSLEKEEKWEEEKKLEEIHARLTEEQKQSLLHQAKKLTTYQETSEHQSLECLPKLSLSDVPPRARDFSLIETSSGPLHLFHHRCFTNAIVYADLVFDLPDIPISDLPLLSLLTRFLTELGCGGRSYEETLAYQQAHLGGINASLSLHVSQENPDLLRPAFSLKGKSLLHRTDKLFTLFSDFLTSPDFTDTKRLRELLAQHISSLQTRLTKNALNYAVQTALSGFSTASLIQNQLSGLPYYAQVLAWAKKFPKDLPEQFQRLYKLIAGGLRADLILSCGEKEFEELQNKAFFHLAPPKIFSPPWKGEMPLSPVSSQARFIAAPVAFSAWGMRTASYRESESPALLLATELLTNCFLHREIREKGGAYGGGASYSPSTGNFYLFANRDPHLAQTIASFQKALEKIAAGEFNERELEEAKLGALQSLDAPVSPGERGAVAYSWKRAGRTFALRDTFRKKILDAKKEEIVHAVSQLLGQQKVFVTLTGKELFEGEEKKFKESLNIIEI